MADNVATEFLSNMKARGRKAMDWFKKIVTKTQRAVVPARTGRKAIDEMFGHWRHGLYWLAYDSGS